MSLRVYGFSGPVVMTLKYYHLLNYSNDIEIGILMVSDIAQNISRNSARERERMVLVRCASASCLKRRCAFCWMTRGSCFQILKKEGLWCSDWVAALKTWNDWLLEIKFCKFCLSKSQQLTGILQVSKASQFDEGSSTCFYRPLTYLEGGKENIATWMKKMAESWEENGKTKFLLVIFVNLLAEEASLWLYRDPFVSQPLEHSTSRRSWWETRWRKDSWHVYTCLILMPYHLELCRDFQVWKLNILNS